MKVFCITQARMNSSRLPGKILKKINHIPLIQYHVRRVSQSKLIDQHIIATSLSDKDQPLVDYCVSHNISYFRGSETNVLDRFYLSAKQFGANSNDLIIRLTADCPLICPELIDQLINLQRENKSALYTSINLNFFPRGFDAEIFSMQTLSEAHSHASTSYQQEHVTPYIYQNLNPNLLFSLKTGKAEWNKIRLCVDEINDFKLIKLLINHFDDNWLNVKAEEICEYILANSDLLTINENVVQKNSH